MILLNFKTQIKGTSKVAGHTDWIEVGSVQLGVGRAISTVSGSADRDTSNPSFSEVTFSKPTDIASPELFMQSVCGKSLGTAEIHFIQTGGADKKEQVYLKVELTDPIVSSYSVSSGGDRPSESFSLNFSKISYQYDAFSGDKVTTGTPKKWDLQANAVF
ncbi:MAG TPA: type VI secretion system tube protein Hcp [Burkholderiaceae bacterium]|nr:type VI secretion system tube protein Hcp [Burkholderiaceae bacterium]